jgi:hypothetical protein
MGMRIEYKFYIGQKVRIIEIDHPAFVVSLYTGRRGNEIQVKYFYNGESKEVYLFENELESINAHDNN